VLTELAIPTGFMHLTFSGTFTLLCAVVCPNTHSGPSPIQALI
jgi:hypothetical protein